MNFLKKFFHIKFTLIIIILFGLLLRLYFMFRRDIFVDEVFYVNVALSNSFKNIFFANHWIKDHGIFYLLALKVATLFSGNVIYLRLFNLIPYILISGYLYFLFSTFNFRYLALLPVFLHSFLSYFVYLESMISPFNLVLLFSTIALISLIKSALFKKNKNLNLIIFTFTSILSFYSDYSSFYFFLNIIPILFWIIKKDKKNIIKLFCSLLMILISILPGLFMITANFRTISTLNNNGLMQGINFWKNLTILSDLLIFRTGGNISLVFFLLALLAVLYMSFKKNPLFIKFIYFFSLWAISINIIFLYIFSKSFFSIFVERSFWNFYLLQIFIFTSILWYLKQKQAYFKFFLTALLLLILIRFVDFKGHNYPGRVPDLNINYQEITSFIKKQDFPIEKTLIVYWDTKYGYIPLQQYYFKNYKSFLINKNIDRLDPSEINILIRFNSNKDNTIRFFQGKKLFIYQIKCDYKNCNFVRLK